MHLDSFIPGELRADVESRRRSRLVLYAVLISSLTTLLAALLVLYLGHTSTAATILLSLFVHPLPLLALWLTRSTTVAGNVFMILISALIVIDYGPDEGYGVLATIALPLAASALLGRAGGAIWTALGVAWAAYLGPSVFRENDFSEAVGLSAAIMTVVVGVAATIIEALRARAAAEAESERSQRIEYQERIEQFVEGAFPSLVVVSGGRIESASPGIKDVLGYEQDEIVGTLSEHLIHPDDAPDVLKQLNAAVGFRTEVRVRHRDGAWRWIEAFAIPLSSSDVDRWVFGARSAQDERASRERLQQAQRLEGLGILAAGLAHNFNNLLTIILGRADVLPPSEDREQIIHAATQASDLTTSIMAFGRQTPHESNIVDIAELVRRLTGTFESLIGPRIGLAIDLPETAHVRIVEGQFEQVMLNLVTNAWEAINDKGMIEIGIERLRLPRDVADALDTVPGDFFCVSVSDSGGGMSEETRQRAFDPYFTTKPFYSGSGLGLASSYGIIKNAGGSIDLASNEGIGTTIKVYLPAGDLEEDAAEPFPTDVPERHEHVLLVEDNQGVRDVLHRVLERFGCTVDFACDGRDAIALARHTPPDLLVTDIIMPEMRGTELAELLRRDKPELPILFISGYPSSNFDAEAIERDPQARFLAKPFRTEEVLQQVQALLPESVETGSG